MAVDEIADHGEGEDTTPAPATSWFRWGGLDLIGSESSEDPSVDAASRPARRRMSRRTRWLLRSGLLVLVACSAAVLRLPVMIEVPGRVVEVAAAVEVRQPATADGPTAQHTGVFLAPSASSRPTALETLVAGLDPDRSIGPATAVLVNGFDPLESALLAGRGISPGRAVADDLGLNATVADGVLTATSLGVLLEIFDRLSAFDLSDGRRILALGAVDADGQLGCVSDASATVAAAGIVDVVVIGQGCPAPQTAAEVVVVPTFADALVSLSQRGG